MSDTVQPPVCNVCNSLPKFQAGNLSCLVSVAGIIFHVWLISPGSQTLEKPVQHRPVFLCEKNWQTNDCRCHGNLSAFIFFFFTSFCTTVCSSDTSQCILLLSNGYYGYCSFDLSKKAKQKQQKKSDHYGYFFIIKKKSVCQITKGFSVHLAAKNWLIKNTFFGFRLMKHFKSFHVCFTQTNLIAVFGECQLLPPFLVTFAELTQINFSPEKCA